MSVHDYYRNVSLMLSRVMNDIGVNEECVMRRRRSNLLLENLYSLRIRLTGQTSTHYMFGSQTEGSTTRGLKSDVDVLFSPDNWRVIQDWKDWSPAILNNMMIRDETTFPGYCKLQALRSDMPLLYEGLPSKYHVYDEESRVILKNDFLNPHLDVAERHGPALQSKRLMSVGIDTDQVQAFHCQTWPKYFKQWSLRREVRDWPTPEMVEYMETSGCFVVPVAHRCSERQDMEWRISTSLAERCLMFSLNITQIRCYVILKMVSKTFIEPFVPDVISSYICKTLLFHTLERTSRDFWREQNLLACVTRVLFRMYSAVYNMDCPNYFYESANLLFGKLDQEGIQERLLLILRKLLHSQGRFLLQIEFDHINSRLKKYFQNTHLTIQYEENECERLYSCVYHTCNLNRNIALVIQYIFCHTDKDVFQMIDLLKTALVYSKEGPVHYSAASTLFPFLCSHIATVDSSERIRRGQTVSPRSLLMYKFSLDSDAASSRLRYASFLYCTGQFESAMSVLRQIEQKGDSGLIQYWCCHTPGLRITKNLLHFAKQVRTDTFLSITNVGQCVKFSRSESHCCPLEMRFEYFRSTDEGRLQRNEEFDDWMDLAVLDCLPYLHYLQFMAARHLRQRDLQYRALHKLIKCTFGKEHLGHRETAFNVLGQCMEHENRFDKALLCYMMSFQQRPRNNAVRWHLARLWYIANQRRQ